MALRQAGFTLIEIMIAMFILAGLSVLMAQSVRTGLQSRTKVQTQLAEESLVRDAMRLISTDIGAAFHHRDYTVLAYNKVLELRKKQAAAARQQTQASGTGLGGALTPPPPGEPTATPTATPGADPLASATPLPTPKQLTGLVGRGDAITLTVRNHVRRYFNAPESDLAMVSYFLRGCKSRADKNSSSNCLVRSERVVLEDRFDLAPTDDENSAATVLAQNVQQFRLRYLSREGTDFIDAWDSTKSATDDKTKGKFPDAIEITLTLQDKTNSASKPRSLTWLAPVRYPNNPDESDKEAAASPTPGSIVSPVITQPGGGQ